MSVSNGQGGNGSVKVAERATGTTAVKLTAKDFKSDQEVRWCPGCGDYAILSAVQGFMPSLGIPRERIVFVSGIGCSSRFPYYMDTYGMHSIHGRAPAIATGLSVSRPDLSVWVITGDGDALSIGGNHLIHALRRNVNLRILLFNNQIYQNCNIFNDGAFDLLKEPDTRDDNQIRLRHGEPIRFGADGSRGVRLSGDGRVELVDVAEVGEDALLRHDAHRQDPGLAFMLSRLSHGADGPTPIGVFRDVERPVYDELLSDQLERATAKQGAGDLDKLLHAGDTWELT